jgi:hypothetical protein
MQWLGEVSGLQDSLRHIAQKKQQAEQIRQHQNSAEANDYTLG